MKTGPFSLSGFRLWRFFLTHLFGDGEEFVSVASYGGHEIVVRGGDADAVKGGVVTGHVFFGETGDVLPGHGVALAGEGGASDETESHIEAPPYGEVYENIEGARRTLAVGTGPRLPRPGGARRRRRGGG